MYQHFVPQFLLKNFAHPYKPASNNGVGEGKTATKKLKKQKYEKGKFPGDSVVHNIDLQRDPAHACIVETPVKRILGQMDMYRDTTAPSLMQQHVEEMFSKLENQASYVFRKIKKSFDEKEPGLWLTRDERNLLRKFLFLLKYRGNTFHQRFSHDRPEEYNANDKEQMLEYMREKGFQRPLDVWFHNLKTIMELKMDAGPKWMGEILEAIYPGDAMWLVNHAQMMYMAICTPERPEDEFILTDSAYNIFEGPNVVVPGEDKGAWANLHEFAPVSPRLMIVLRSNLIPVPEEDIDEEIKAERDLRRFGAVDSVFAPGTKSLLHDLPINKARNNYSRVVNGRVELLEGENGITRSRTHRFLFNFYPIPKEHVFKVNALLLDNAYTSTSVIFNNRESLAESLEWYLTAPCSIGKNLVDNADLRLACLKKLAAVSKSLGSTKEPVWKTSEPPIALSKSEIRRLVQSGFQEMAVEMLEAAERDGRSGGLKVYTLLGQSMPRMYGHAMY